MSDVYDNVAELYGGMNSNVLSSKPGERQYFKGVNITCRGGKIRTRPGFNILDLTFNNLTDKHVFEHGKFQGGDVYQTPNATYLICAVSGNVFAIEPETGRTANITAVTGRMDQMVDRLFFCQVEGYMVVQDGSNLAVIIDGPAARKAVPGNNEVPVGTIMAYGHGRLFVKVTPNSFMAGDINLPSTPGAVLRFTETAYLSGGGAFSLPGSLGEITAMTFVQHFETGSGQGPLVVFGKRGFETFDVFTPRSFWTDQDIGKVQLQGDGCSSASGVVVANEDLIFRTWHGLASYLLTRELLPNRTLVDMSAEMMAYEEQETSWMRPLSSMVFFDNRILFTIVGEKIDAETLEGEAVDDYRFKAIGSLDMQPLTGITQNQVYPNGVYDGIWTGINPTALVAGNFDDVERCFVFGKTNDGINTVHEIGNSSGHDCDMNPIQCRLYLRALSFFDFSKGIPSSAIYNNKTVNRAHLYLDGVEDDVDFILYGKPDHRSQFTRLSTMSVRAPTVYSPPPHTIVESGIAQGRAKYAFPDLIPRQGDPIFDLDVLTGYEFEFCVEWSGCVCLTRLGFEAVTIDEIARIGDETEGKLLPPADLDDFGYQSGCLHLRDMALSVPPLVWYLGVAGTWTPDVDVWFYPDDGSGPIFVPAGTETTGDGVIVVVDPDIPDDWDIAPPGWFPPVTPWTPPDPRDWPPPDPDEPTVPVIPGQPPLPKIPLPKPEEGDWFPGVTVEIYEADGVTVTDTIQRGTVHKVRLRAFKYFTYNGTTYCKPWTDIPAGLNAYIALRTYGGGDFPVVAGDEFLIANTCPVLWDANGEVLIDGVVNGGALPQNDVNVEAYISYPGAPTNIMWAGRGPIHIVPSTLVADMVVAPIAPATTTFNVTVGGASQTQHWGVANTVVGTYLQWKVTLINVDAALAGLITTAPSQYSGMGVAGGMLDDVAVTVSPTAGPGTYAATLHFAATIGDGTVLTQDVVLSVVVATDIPPLFPGVPPLANTYQIRFDGVMPPPGGVVLTYDGIVTWWANPGTLYQVVYEPTLYGGPCWLVKVGFPVVLIMGKYSGTTPAGIYDVLLYGSAPAADPRVG